MSMGISDISNAIKSLFDVTRQPAPEIPGALMAIGCTQKPGLSTIVSTGNIIKALSKHGIPTDPMPDGGENKVVAYTMAVVDEIFRAIREDANIQVAHTPGAITVLTTGANSGGPVVSQGFNINFSKGQAIVQ
jgi:hypothetical protein